MMPGPEVSGASKPVEIPPLLPILPVRDRVIFPSAVSALAVGQPRSVRLLEDVMRTHRMLGAVLQRDAGATPSSVADLHQVGCAAIVQQLVRAPDGTFRIIVQGLDRIRLDSFAETEPFLVGRVERPPWLETPGTETDALVRTTRSLFHRLVELTELPDELAGAADALEDPRLLGYLVGASAPFPAAARQELLDASSPLALLRRVVELLQQELAVREMQARIATETRQQVSKAQRDYLLREQLRTIQRELGEEDPEAAEVKGLRERLDATALSPEARREAERELSRLERMPAAAPEHGIIRTYLDWLLSLPWGKTSGGAIDLAKARAILDADHYDLDRIKDRILDLLAVRKLRQDRQPAVSLAGSGDAGHAAHAGPLPQTAEDEARREPILCLVGPPGVGKTSLGQSIARAMGRRFVRLSLGGVHDEAEIRGHRRTYIGAIPGRLVQALRRAEVSDPVMMLDEVDKLGASFQGDPAAALLEVLDPAQNHAFTDTYLGVPFDLSHVFFICTANTIETISSPLLDRMEVLALSGYTDAEKLHIARRYLLPAQIRASGLREGELAVEDAAILRVIREYTREAGVRSLERALATIARKAARRIGEGSATEVRVSAGDVPALLGRPRFVEEAAERIDRPGIATGLAWTPVGGDILFVEAAFVPGRGDLVLTGMLGDVMRESAQAAVTWVRSNAARLGIDPNAFQGNGLHIHVPAGAIPKDGPSAGVAITTAVVSLARGVPVRNDLAMTGEITLRGKVLPVGGIKEKVLAAHRVGLKTVILPRRNEGDLEDVPEEARRALQFVFADSAEEVLAAALPARRDSEVARTEPSPPPVH